MSILNVNVGDRVYLMSDMYTPSQANPVKGSKYECKGTICEILPHKTAEPFNCLVQWDTGIINNYIISTDLMLVDTVCTNYKSIW